MLNKNQLGNILSVSTVLVASALFVLKYSEIYLGAPAVITIFYLIFAIAVLFVVDKKEIIVPGKVINAVMILIGVLAFAYVLTIPRIGEVNRLTAIQDWWSLYERGEFPYNSGLTPSSFPGLFFIAYPFFKLNLLGLLEPLGIIILFFLVRKFNRGEKESLFALILILITPFVYYSLVVRCELLFNTVLILLVFYLLLKYDVSEKFDSKFFLLSAVTGFAASTRSVFIIPLIVFSLFYFRNDLKKLVIFAVFAGAVFVLLLAPFYFWDTAAFLNNGPFAIQSKLSALPFGYVLFFILVAVYAGWVVSNIKEVFLVSGVILFLLPLISYIYKIFEFGFTTAFFHDKIDLSYLAFSFPFLLLSIEGRKVKKYFA